MKRDTEETTTASEAPENAPKVAESVELTLAEIATIGEFEQAVRDIQQQAQGALRLIAKQRGLQGQWSVCGNKLVKAG